MVDTTRSAYRLSGLDAAFLALDNRFSQMHTLKFAVLEPVDAAVPLTADVIFEMFPKHLHAVPCYTQKLRMVPFGLHHPVLVNATDFRFEDHVHVRTVPAPGGRRERDAVIADVCGGTLSRNRPLWELWILEGLEGGKLGCLIKLHHALADGRVSINQLLTFADAAPAALDIHENTPAPITLIRDGLRDRMLDLAKIPALIRDTRRMRRETKAIIEEATSTPPSLLSCPPTLFSERVSPVRTWGTASLPLAQVSTVAKSYGVSVNDVLLTMLGTAAREYLIRHDALPSRSLPGMLPVDTSTPDIADALQGNHWATLMTTLATDESDIVARLHAIRAAMAVGKQLRKARGGLFERYAQYLNVALLRPIATAYLESRLAKQGKLPPLGASNVRGPDSPAVIEGVRISEFYSVGPLPTSAVNVTAWSYAGQFNMSLLTGRNVIPDAYEFLDLMREALEELHDRAEPTEASTKLRSIS